MTPYDTVLEAVGRKGLKTQQASGQILAQCPTHDDNKPSLAIKESDGKVLLFCHAGCDARDVVADLDLTMEDLFDGDTDIEKNPVPVARYDYVDGITGEVLWTKERYYPKTFKQFHTDHAGQRVWGVPKDVKPWLYHSLELKEGLDRGDPIWLVEGEADVHAVEAMGGVATTQCNGAGPGKWLPFHTHLLRRAQDIRIVVDLDDDWTDRSGKVKNTGRDYALEVRQLLTNDGRKVTLWKSPYGKDASDALRAGKKLDDFERYPLERERVEGITGSELQVKEFPPLVYAVQGILPQGVAILAASPKGSKSFMTLDMAIGVATGGIAMSQLQCTKGDVLYVGLEDSERRLKDRTQLLFEFSSVPDLSRIEFQTIDSGWVGGVTGLGWMEEWASEVKDPRLIVIDTLRKAEPELDEARNLYVAEQETMLRYKRFADRHNCTIVLVHHNNKSTDDGDWLDRFSGSKGLTGGADTLLYIDFKRGERDGHLRVEGRDVVADDIPIFKPRGRPFWVAKAAPDSLENEVWAQDTPKVLSSRQIEILKVVSEAEDGSITGPDLHARFPGYDIAPDLRHLSSQGSIKLRGTGIELA